MKKLGLIISGTGISFALLIFLYSSQRAKEPTNISPDLSAQTPTSSQIGSNKPKSNDSTLANKIILTTPGPTDDQTLSELKKSPALETYLPRVEDVRAELNQDPHNTPKALLAFSVALSDQMDLALRSLPASRYLLAELQICASQDKTPSSAAAICIKNAYELSAKYEELTPDADALKSKAPPEAQQIFKNMKSMGL